MKEHGYNMDRERKEEGEHEKSKAKNLVVCFSIEKGYTEI